MGLQDRDYVRERRLDYSGFAPTRWWHKWQSWLAIAVTVVGLASATLWVVRDARSLLPSLGPEAGSLIVNVNSASDAQLQTVPGIGPATAAQIIAGRPWESVDALIRIQGIGPKKLQSLRPFLTTSAETHTREPQRPETNA